MLHLCFGLKNALLCNCTVRYNRKKYRPQNATGFDGMLRFSFTTVQECGGSAHYLNKDITTNALPVYYSHG